MLVRTSDGEYEDIDFRETAPAAAFQDMYKNNVVLSLPAPNFRAYADLSKEW